MPEMGTSRKRLLGVIPFEFMQQLYIAENYSVPEKRDYVFYNNLSNKCLVTIIFGILSNQTMRHQKMVSIPTSPI